jgi:hypothetical protein
VATSYALLLIADIGGYTRFMSATRTALTHAQQVVADLLGAVIDASEPELKLAKLEGDAAFFYAVREGGQPPSPEELQGLLARMRCSFLRALEQTVIDNVCSCDGCSAASKLTLKFVAHQGEVAFQKIRQLTELAGVDVILVHRMLKNEVPISEYVLVTDSLLPGISAELRPAVQSLPHDFEGIGAVQTHYLALDRLPQTPPPRPEKSSWLKAWWKHLGFMLRALPLQLGLKPFLAGFRHLTREGGPETRNGLSLPPPASPSASSSRK